MQKVKLFFLDTSLYRLMLMLSLFFSMVMYTENIGYIFTGIFVVWGLFLTGYSIIVRKSYKNMYFGFWLIAFFASLLITTLVNIGGDIKEFLYNILILFLTAICFFVFYGMHTELGVPFRWELYLMVRIFVYLSTVFTLIGLILMFFTSGRFDNYMYYEGVFKGFYINPNYQGYVSAVSIIFCHMLTKKNFIAHSGQARVSRIWLVSCVLLNSMALLLCDSTASLLLIGMYIAVIVGIKIFSMIEDLTFKKMLPRILAIGIAGVILVILMLYLRASFRIGVVSMYGAPSPMDARKMGNIDSASIVFNKNDTGITSRMFLWSAGVKIFTQNPIFGIGRGSVCSQIIAVTGRLNYKSQYEGFQKIAITDLHSGYLTILVAAGIVGFIFFMIFFFRTFRMIVPVWFVHRQIMSQSVYPCLLAFILSYCVYALVERTILFDLTFLVLSFWLILGYTSCFALDYQYRSHGSVRIFGRQIPKRLF